MALLVPCWDAATTASAAVENEGLVAYAGPKNLRAKRRIAYPIACSAPCHVTATTTLVLPGRDIGPIVASSDVDAGKTVQPYLFITSNAALRTLREHVHKAVLRTQVSAEALDGSAEDVDQRDFHFHR